MTANISKNGFQTFDTARFCNLKLTLKLLLNFYFEVKIDRKQRNLPP